MREGLSFQKYSPVLLVLGSVVLLAGLYTWQSVSKQHQGSRSAVPAVRALTVDETQQPFTDLSGNEVALGQHIGQVLVVNSWASWSPFSATELPLLVEQAAAYGSDEVKIIAINRGEDRQTAERFLRSIGVADGVELVLDPDDHFYQSIGGYAMPETLFYDRTGNVVFQKHGTLTADEVKQHIEAAVQAGE